jgi:hypothetical protein
VHHTVGRARLETFLREASQRADGGGLPRFVEQEFRQFLTCGVLAHGFARLRCDTCALERLVPFSCKGRGFCSSCGGRRMTERGRSVSAHGAGVGAMASSPRAVATHLSCPAAGEQRAYQPRTTEQGVLYQIVRNAFSKHPVLYEEIAKKTESLVREWTRAYTLSTSMPLVKIDEKTLEALRKADGAGPAKVINLGKSLIQGVTEVGEQQPYLLPIGERAEAILELYDDRQTSTQEALKQLERLLTEYVQATREREQTGFDLNTFTIYWVLKQAGASEPERAASLINAAFGRFSNYLYNVAHRRHLKAELYKVLLPVVGRDRMVELAEQILRLQRR